jgi:hypothetical protein
MKPARINQVFRPLIGDYSGMSGSGIHVSLGGLSGLGVALLGLTLASERFGGDFLLTTFCLFAGIACIVTAVVLKIDDYLWSREAYKKANHLE